MTLQEAYQSWQQLDDNRVLYAKTREAFQKTWFHLPTDKPCSYYTKDVLVQAMAAAATVFGGFKVRAASVMCHVLTYASQVEPKDNPKPDFTFSDLVRPAGDSGGQQRDAKKTKVRVIPCPSAASMSFRCQGGTACPSMSFRCQGGTACPSMSFRCQRGTACPSVSFRCQRGTACPSVSFRCQRRKSSWTSAKTIGSVTPGNT